MKQSFFALLMSLLTLGVWAQPGGNDRYTAAMKRNLSAIDSSFRNPADLLSLSNSFERIAVAEKTQWLPFYYAAFLQVNYAFMAPDKSTTDPIADKAEQLILQADSLMPQNSEISCLRSMIATVRMLVNPMQRYQQYGVESEKHLALAMAQDSANPRPHFLKGQSLRNTPPQFGGGCASALPFLQAALDKYERFTPASDLHPTWGRNQAQQTYSSCP